ncbi:MAG: MBL fold metallo-hydrolase [Tissierellaceae bacterium]|jgi:L-ascorbate metabolism protein UlaG (beta-lactamase superfamily)
MTLDEGRDDDLDKLNVTVNYIAHSGFAVETENRVLIFDYFKGQVDIEDRDKDIYVFSSHGHRDHFNPIVLDWKKDFKNIHYILSKDIDVEEDNSITLMGPYKEYFIDGLRIKTFGSTDQGVSFLVSVDGLNIFHAGDLHWWYWERYSEIEKINMENSFKIKVKRLKNSGLDIDIAFFPVDPRLEDNFHLGGEYFISEIRPKYFFPMHSWDKYEIIDDFIHKVASPYTKIVDINHKNQNFKL